MLIKSVFIISMSLSDLTAFANAVKLRFAVISFTSILALASLHLLLNFNQPLRILPGTYGNFMRGRPASKLPPIFDTHQLSREELDIKLNVSSDITCGGIDVNSILHVKAATIIDPDLDTFLSESNNYPQLGLHPSTWEDEGERAYWAYLNAVSLWRPISRTYWTINRIVYTKGRHRFMPWFSYAWWQEWNEAGTQLVGSGIIPIFIPQHRENNNPEGPEDPRLFEDPNGNVCFVFSMLDMDDIVKIWMYNTTSERQVALHSPDGRETQRVNKNWTPFIHDGQIKFVFSYKPVTIVACDFSSGACHYDYAEEYNPGISELRGGSNWVPWYDSGYYLAFAHTLTHVEDVSFYRLSLVVLSTHDELFRIAYASGPLDLNNVTLLEPLGIHRNVSELDEREWDHGRLLLSGSVTRTDLFDRDSILITVSTSDNSTTLLEVGGISDVMEAVLENAERETSWHTDDGKVVECAERAAKKHYENVALKFGG